jgi:cobalt/nickel transport protein
VTRGRSLGFLLGFLAVALLVAGGFSYLASPDPDGLDTVALQGCQVTGTDAGEQLTGTCIAQHTTDHAMSSSPLADYAVGGSEGTTGLAGILGVIVTLALAGGLFWALRRRGVAHTDDGRG